MAKNTHPIQTKTWKEFFLSLSKHEPGKQVWLWNGYQRYLWERENGRLNNPENTSVHNSLFHKSFLEVLRDAPILTNAELAKTGHPKPVRPELLSNESPSIDFDDDIDFDDGINFEKMIFPAPQKVNFQNFLFALPVYFTCAKFNDLAFFDETIFSERVYFNQATFRDGTYFNQAIFCHNTYFNGVIFFENAHFENTEFDKTASFRKATFHKRCRLDVFKPDMPPSYLNFGDATFKAHPPELFDRRLNTGSSWHRIKLLGTPKTQEEIDLYQNAYERLRILANSLGKVSDEHRFFRKEMDCKLADAVWMFNRTENGKEAVKAENKKGQQETSKLRPFLQWKWRYLLTAIFYWLYKISSNYGHSIFKPVKGLLLFGVLGLPAWSCLHFKINFLSFCGNCDFSLTLAGQAALYSFGHLFSSLAYLIPVEIEVWKDPSVWLTVLISVQGIIGFIFLFLIGLAIRNILRLR